MNEQVQKQLQEEQQHMSRQATRLVLVLSIIIHIILNIYARMTSDDFLKMLIPVVTVISIVVVALTYRFYHHSDH
jgi:hypothetical protein